MGRWDSASLIGKVFGRLTVIELAEKTEGFRPVRRWLCKCSCGSLCTVTTGNLNGGSTNSCGCIRSATLHLDLTGRTFHNLTVIKGAGKRKTLTLWECDCKCGEKAFVRTCDLEAGRVRSCGCLRSGGKLATSFGTDEAMRNLVYFMYRDNAKTRDRAFDLTVDQATALFQQDCHYCGAPPSRTRTRRNRKGSYTYNGIDRLRNDEGYVQENVVACCTQCNLLKGSMDSIEFISWICRVYHHVKREKDNR